MSDAGSTLHGAVLRVLTQYLNPIVATGVLSASLKRAGIPADRLDGRALGSALLDELGRGLRFYSVDETRTRQCLDRVRGLGSGRGADVAEPAVIQLTKEADVAQARGQARVVAESVGFNHTDQIKIATSVSEVARNIVTYAGSGSVEIVPVSSGRRGLRIKASDKGPGIPNLDQILAGSYRSKTGMGLGIRGCRQLMDEFQIRTQPGTGTEVVMVKYVS